MEKHCLGPPEVLAAAQRHWLMLPFRPQTGQGGRRLCFAPSTSSGVGKGPIPCLGWRGKGQPDSFSVTLGPA